MLQRGTNYLGDKGFKHAVYQIFLIPSSETHSKTAKGSPALVCLPRFLERLMISKRDDKPGHPCLENFLAEKQAAEGLPDPTSTLWWNTTVGIVFVHGDIYMA